MKTKRELATKRGRVYPSDYEKIMKLAEKRNTTFAQIIHEKFGPSQIATSRT